MWIGPVNSVNCHERPFPWHPQTRTRHFSDIEIGMGREKKKMPFEDLRYEERQRGEDNKENMMKVSGRRRAAAGEVYINPRPFTGARSCKCMPAIRGAKAS